MGQADVPRLRPVTLFLCGDVMTGRGIDQILPRPSNPRLHEPYVRSALDYVEMAERVNGPIQKPVDLSYIWGDALAELDRAMPAARIVNLETSVTTSESFEPKGINYRMHPANVPCLTVAKIDCCVLANNHVLDWGRSGLEDTLNALNQAGIKTSGAGRNLTEAQLPAVIEVGANTRILVFAAATTDSGVEPAWMAADAKSGVVLLPDPADASVAAFARQVAKVKRPGDLAILSIHWGGNWGYSIRQEHRLFVHKLIDGAQIDVVHGHSSHHPKGIEIYKDKPVLYGCGDFLNDYEGIPGYEEFRSHLVLAYFLTLDPRTGKLLNMRLSPFETKRLQLRRPGSQDVTWLADLLTREGRALGTRVHLDGCGGLALAWSR